MFTGFTSMAFCCSPRVEYHFGILHFSVEMTLSPYFCFPAKIAFNLVLCTYFLLALFDIAGMFIFNWDYTIATFFIFFVFSDTYPFVAICTIPQNIIPTKFRDLCMGLSIHYIVCHNTLSWFVFSRLVCCCTRCSVFCGCCMVVGSSW